MGLGHERRDIYCGAENALAYATEPGRGYPDAYSEEETCI